MNQLIEYIKNQIWIYEYPIRFASMDLFGRMTVIKLDNGELIIHDPGEFDSQIRQSICGKLLFTTGHQKH